MDNLIYFIIGIVIMVVSSLISGILDEKYNVDDRQLYWTIGAVPGLLVGLFLGGLP